MKGTRNRRRILCFFETALCLAAPLVPCRPQPPAPQGQPLPTEERLRLPGWWPTQSTPRRDEYVGPTVCAECHSSEAAVQETTPMAKACVRATDSKTLQANERLSARSGPYTYEIVRTANGSVYSVNEGERSISALLGWAFGGGDAGETYIFARAGILYESQFSYFPILKALDFTPGHPHSTPANLEEAVGRRLDAAEAQRCFGCHNTASSTGGQFEPEHLISGVTCEACHGPGARHVSAMKEGRIDAGLKLVLNPAKLDPVDSVDFCGACHQTWADVLQGGAEGLTTVRFQPYRLELSRCWGKDGSPGITCLACHDPHQPLARDPGSYDDRCLRCHRLATKGSTAAVGHLAAACPRANKDCVTCHMPKYEVPGTHTKFTDHFIGIARSEAYHAR